MNQPEKEYGFHAALEWRGEEGEVSDAQPVEFDREALTRTFACETPEKMNWRLFDGGFHECNGCPCSCGTSDQAPFLKPPEQQTLFK